MSHRPLARPYTPLRWHYALRVECSGREATGCTRLARAGRACPDATAVAATPKSAVRRRESPVRRFVAPETTKDLSSAPPIAPPDSRAPPAPQGVLGTGDALRPTVHSAP